MKLHLCSTWCKVLCLIGHHVRLDPEGKCRCCDGLDFDTAHEQARSRDWSHLTTRWWE